MSITDILKINDYKSKITALESTVASLNQRVNSLYDELATERSNVNRLQHELSQRNEFINSHLALFDTERINIVGNFEYYQQVWADTWGFDIHGREYQIERQYRGRHRCYTPLSLDSSAGTGTFRGKYTDYCTSLRYCSCMDFQRRGMPCKHMYRLAHEFDVFMLDGVEYDANIHSYPHMDALANSLQPLSSTCREIIYELCSDTVSVVNRSAVTQLLSLNLVTISENKAALLDCYAKDELFRLLPENSNVKKSLRKAELITTIISDYPQVITDLERLTIPIQLASNIAHFNYEIRHFLNQ